MTDLLQHNPAFLKAQPLLNTIRKSGFEAYFVGGSVRDAMLNLPASNDIDIATSAFPNEIKRIFKRTVDVGIEHGTVMVIFDNISYEVTTFRVESTYKDFRRPDSVTFVRSLKEDLKRRDFTINAMALDEDGQLIDYFGGVADLENQLIRAVGKADERFSEDALRMMRAVRFAGHLNFTIEQKTQSAIEMHAYLLEKIAVERIKIEFIKLMLSKSMAKGLKYFIETDLYRYCPQLKDKGNALLELLKVEGLVLNESMAWALLLFLAGVAEPSQIKSFLKAWKTSNQVIDDTIILVQGLTYRENQPYLSNEALFNLGEGLSHDVEYMRKILGKDHQVSSVLKAYQALTIQRKDELAINGSQILEETQLKPGRWLGRIIDEILIKVINKDLANEPAELMEYVMNHVDY